MLPLRLIFYLVLISVGCAPSNAELVTDGSIGVPLNQTLPGPHYQITESLGKLQGNNLFHSFSKFDLQRQEQATFQTHSAVEHVITRVTGGMPSKIDGTVAVSGSRANLWLINPHGWMLGPHANFNLEGVLNLSTASSVGFQDGSAFHAKLGNASILSVAAPLTLALDRISQGKIDLDRTTIQLPDYQTLNIVAGEIRLNDAHIQIPGGQINLAALTDGSLEVDHDGLHTTEIWDHLGSISMRNQFAFDQQSNTQRDTLTVSPYMNSAGSSLVDGGKITVLGKQIELSNVSISAIEISGHRGGDMQFFGESLYLSGSSLFSSAFTSGTAGNIQVSGNQLTLTNKSNISTSSGPKASETSEPGRIQLQLNDSLTLRGQSQIKSNTTGAARGGQIEIDAAHLALSEDAAIRTVTTRDGRGGLIDINADNIDLQSGGTLDSSSSFRNGQGGAILIQTRLMSVRDPGSEVTASTFGNGNAGTIAIQTKNLTVANQAQIRTLSQGGSGDAGSIALHVDNEFWLDNAKVNTSATDLRAEGGPISVDAETLFIRHGQLTTSVGQPSDLSQPQMINSNGNGGNIRIGGRYLVMDGGYIQANAFAQHSTGGEIDVDSEHLIVSGSEHNLLVNGEHVSYDATKRSNIIQAVAPLGVNGNVTINHIELNIAGQLLPLDDSFAPKRFIDDNPCRVQRGQSISSLVALSSGGLPQTARSLAETSLSRHLKSHLTAASQGHYNAFDCMEQRL